MTTPSADRHHHGDADGHHRSDEEIFDDVSDVMDQLRAARRLAEDDPDPEVRKRALWFVRDVTWVIDKIIGRIPVVGALVLAGLSGLGRVGRRHVASNAFTSAAAATTAGVVAVTIVAWPAIAGTGDGDDRAVPVTPRHRVDVSTPRADSHTPGAASAATPGGTAPPEPPAPPKRPPASPSSPAPASRQAQPGSTTPGKGTDSGDSPAAEPAAASPGVSLPGVSLPEVSLPEVPLPTLVPGVELPALTPPPVTLPPVTLPPVTVPPPPPLVPPVSVPLPPPPTCPPLPQVGCQH